MIAKKMCTAKFRRDCEIFAMVAKFSQSLQNFRYVIAKILHSLHCLLHQFSSISSVPLDISSSQLDEIAENLQNSAPI